MSDEILPLTEGRTAVDGREPAAARASAEPSRVIASLARDQVTLDLKTVDLCLPRDGSRYPDIPDIRCTFSGWQR